MCAKVLQQCAMPESMHVVKAVKKATAIIIDNQTLPKLNNQDCSPHQVYGNA